MTDARMAIRSPVGLLHLRRELASDQVFRFDLFCLSRPAEWDLVRFNPDVLAQLMRHQFHAQTVGYQTQFPHATFDIIELADEPIGRLVVDRPGAMIHLVDQAIVPRLRNRGIGTAILQTILDEAVAAGLPVRLEVASTSAPSFRLYQRLGFTIAQHLPMHLVMEWHRGK